MTSPPTVRTITDPAVLAALAHPTRRRVLDALKTTETATVGMLAAQLGVAAGSVSHHLKVLSHAELVSEVTGHSSDRRERWWKLVDAAIRWSSTGFDNDPVTEAIVAAAGSLGLERQVELSRRSLAAADRPDAWTGSAFASDTWLSLSPGELNDLAQEIQGVLSAWRERATTSPSSDAERTPCFVFARGFRAQP